MKRQLKRSAFDFSHVKSVTAWALVFKGEYAGKIVANYSDNPNGSVVTATVAVYVGPITDWSEGSSTGAAGGGGYCKFSAAVSDAFHRMEKCPNNLPPLSGYGEGAIREFLKSLGYEVYAVI